MNLLAVNFHYFREEIYPSGIYPTSEAALRQQIDALAKEYEFVDQATIIEYLDGDRPILSGKKCCLITWDDGLKEQMQAFDLLQELGVPAVFYIPTRAVITHQVLDVHKLHLVRSQKSDAHLYQSLVEKFSIDKYVFDEVALANQYRYDNTLARKVKYFLNFMLNAKEKAALIQSWFLELVPSEEGFAQSFYMDAADIRKLATVNAIGAHGHSHIPLAPLSTAAAQEEIEVSVSLLSEMIDLPILSFSYPFGGKTAVSEKLLPCFANTNIRFALTMWRGENRLHDPMFEPFLLHRVDTNDAPGGKKNTLN